MYPVPPKARRAVFRLLVGLAILSAAFSLIGARPTNSRRVTAAAYNRISMGMNLDEVKTILGGEPDAAGPSHSYHWPGKTLLYWAAEVKRPTPLGADGKIERDRFIFGEKQLVEPVIGVTFDSNGLVDGKCLAAPATILDTLKSRLATMGIRVPFLDPFIR